MVGEGEQSNYCRRAGCGCALSGSTSVGSHRSEARYGVAKRQEPVGWATRRGEASAVVGVGATAYELVGMQSSIQG